jgi:type II secretory pathway pseudopilin PulG
MKRRRQARGDAGAVFVESMIAAAIVAMALGATFQVIVDSAGRERAAAARLTALQIAQSEMANVGAEIPLAPGQTAGVAGAMIWQVDITPFSEGDDVSDAGSLWHVAVTVRPRAAGRNLVELTSLRLAPAA